MTTYQKNIHYLKKAIFNKLDSDDNLSSLLGGNYIYHRQPPKDAKYPCVIYNIISDVDNVFGEDRSTGEITRAYFRINIFSRSKKSEESDNIEARIKKLFHGQRNLDTTEIICYSCFRDNILESRRDPDTDTWITSVRYQVTWGVKEKS